MFKENNINNIDRVKLKGTETNWPVQKQTLSKHAIKTRRNRHLIWTCDKHVVKTCIFKNNTV